MRSALDRRNDLKRQLTIVDAVKQKFDGVEFEREYYETMTNARIKITTLPKDFNATLLQTTLGPFAYLRIAANPENNMSTYWLVVPHRKTFRFFFVAAVLQLVGAACILFVAVVSFLQK